MDCYAYVTATWAQWSTWVVTVFIDRPPVVEEFIMTSFVFLLSYERFGSLLYGNDKMPRWLILGGKHLSFRWQVNTSTGKAGRDWEKTDFLERLMVENTPIHFSIWLMDWWLTNKTKYYKPLNHCVYQCDTALKTWFKTDGSREIILSSPIELYCINKPNCMKHAFLLLCFLLLTPPPLPNTHTPPNFSSPSKNVTHNPPKENPLVNRTTEYAVKFHTV